MVRQKVPVPAVVALIVAALGVVLVVLLVLIPGGSSKHSGSQAAAISQPFGPPALATYSERVPHVASQLNAYALQGTVKGAASTPQPTEPPLSTSAFRAPVAAYKAYSEQQLELMENDIARLHTELATGDRAGAEDAWRAAFADYLTLGAVYLEGPVADLDQAIDGNPGGLKGGTASPRFTGLHRIEFGLWTGAALASLEPYAQRLGSDVVKLRRLLPRVQVDPLDYATRAHEILEDAVRDLLNGADVPWSDEGVLGTAAGVAATTEVIKTLAPVLKSREGVLGVVDVQLGALRSTLASLKAQHGGQLPANSQLTQVQSERLNASIGQTLEALAQVPGALETTTTQSVPSIPRDDVRIVP
jgi:iron uptake system EfeUOB component EfeO/EfeM